MFNISFRQILFLTLIFFFLFGDFLKFKKKIQKILTYLKNFTAK